MDLRCFGTRPRTWLNKLTYHWQDYVLIGLGAAMLITGVVANYGFHVGGFWVPEFWINLAGG
jgi:energy-coupling factor transporter transmembrane protein EcfT